MPVRTLDHVNIRTRDMAATVAFFHDVLDMARSDRMPGWLLDQSGRAVIHVADESVPYPTDDWMPFAQAESSGIVHHIAFDCDDIDAMRTRLNARGYIFRENHVPQVDLDQIFVFAPGGLLVELNFFAAPQSSQ